MNQTSSVIYPCNVSVQCVDLTEDLQCVDLTEDSEIKTEQIKEEVLDVCATALTRMPSSEYKSQTAHVTYDDVPSSQPVVIIISPAQIKREGEARSTIKKDGKDSRKASVVERLRKKLQKRAEKQQQEASAMREHRLVIIIILSRLFLDAALICVHTHTVLIINRLFHLTRCVCLSV